jgi:hypothetical protein
MRTDRRFIVLSIASLALGMACSSNSGSGFGNGSGDGSGPGAGHDGGTTLPGMDGSQTTLPGNDATTTQDAQLIVGDPTTCAEAASSKSYVGCEYWPTVTANGVESIFDFAAVVANTQTVPATVTVTGPNSFYTTATVPANGLTTIYLPWVTELKGPDLLSSFPTSVTVVGGAYHLIASVPVSVYQFNALEYKGVGGPPGKDWSSCLPLGLGGCYSYTNDASVLIPVAAMTGNYRVTSEHGSTYLGDGGFIAITATAPGATMVTVTLSSTASIVGSAASSILSTGPNGMVSFALKAGDVVELAGVGTDENDLSGSLVYATQPVQVLAGRQCAFQPDPMAACDHLESSVLPAETLGKDYVVTVPTSPHQTVVGHIVRFYGNVDGTTLTYSPSQPAGCPSTLNAGEVVECTGTPDCATGQSEDEDAGAESISVTCVTETFEVTGTHEFAVSSFMLGGSAVDPNSSTGEGDPSMSPMVAVEQYRSRYIFLAPTDYDESYADVVLPTGATITLDGAPLPATPSPTNATWSVARVTLGAGQNGAHVMTGSKPFGVQVIGYGSYTSYQYPAGLDLALIAPPPPPPPMAK